MAGFEAVYGSPPATLARLSNDAVQVSPLVVGASDLGDFNDGALRRVIVVAPPSTLERRYVLAQCLRVLATGGEILAMAPNARGGTRLAKELQAFGCHVVETARQHHRICRAVRPSDPVGLDAAIIAGGPQLAPSIGMWSQPGVFSWDRLDPGSGLLLAQPWKPAGAGVDLGCGVGVLARAAITSPEVTEVTLIDIDRRAVNASMANLSDARARFLQHDLRQPLQPLAGLDFAIMNPPFHNAGTEDRGLGRAFVAAAAAMLRRGGYLRMVANVTVPYASVLSAHFGAVSELARAGGYRVFEARR